jgi:hypothetical protein
MLRSPVGPFLGLREAFMRMNVPGGLPEPSQGGRRPGAPDVSLGRLFLRSDKDAGCERWRLRQSR